MIRIKQDLPNHVCQTCGNLTYYDWYMCKIGKHRTKEGFLRMEKLKHCDGYIKRYGANGSPCKGVECVYWCHDCSIHEGK